MANPYYKIVGSKVTRSPEPERVNADSEDYQDPRDFGRGATGQAPVVDERSMVEDLLSGAHESLGRADILSRQIQKPSFIGPGESQGRFSRMAGSIWENLKAQPIVQALSTPAGQAMAGEAIGPLLGLMRGAGQTPGLLSRLRPEGPLPYKPAMPYGLNDASSLAGLRNARPSNLEQTSALEALAAGEEPARRSVMFGGVADEGLRMASPAARGPVRIGGTSQDPREMLAAAVARRAERYGRTRPFVSER